MSITTDGKVYYTGSEIKEKLKASVRIKAKKIAKTIKSEILSKELFHV